MKNQRSKITLGVLLLFPLLLSSPIFFFSLKATDFGTLQDYQKDLEENRKKQAGYKNKILELQEKAKSLKNQIAYMDNQIGLTQSQIDESLIQINAKEAEISELSLDIDKLKQRLERLKSSLEYQAQIYKERARESYKASKLTPIEIIFGSESLGELLTRVKYLNVLEEQDKALLKQMKQTQDSYNAQKILLEEKKTEVERLKAEIEEYKATLESKKASLESQKEAKKELLSITRNDEATYQKLLAETQAEQRAVENAIAKFTAQLIEKGVPAGTEVKRGDIIGIQGSTGLSTGDHVHFGVYERCGDSWCHTNPEPYLDSGELDWPIEDFEVSQWYGETEFARSSGFYANNFHNGIDLYGPFGSAVKAAADGKVSYSLDAYGGKGALIYHSEELMTIYWHLK